MSISLTSTLGVRRQVPTFVVRVGVLRFVAAVARAYVAGERTP